MNFRIASIITLALLTASMVLPVGAQRTGGGGQVKTFRVDLSKERSGHESGKFLSVVGNWSIVEDGLDLLQMERAGFEEWLWNI